MKIVLDSSILIDYFRTKSLESPYARLKTKHDLVISLITVVEIYSGKSLKKEKEGESVEKILDSLEIIIPDVETAKVAGRLRMEYQLSLGDAFIAALALDLDLPLATLDSSDFKRIKGLELYPVK